MLMKKCIDCICERVSTVTVGKFAGTTLWCIWNSSCPIMWNTKVECSIVAMLEYASKLGWAGKLNERAYLWPRIASLSTPLHNTSASTRWYIRINGSTLPPVLCNFKALQHALAVSIPLHSLPSNTNTSLSRFVAIW
jgi:hypothetical protein